MLPNRIDAEFADVDLHGDIVDQPEVLAKDGVVVDDTLLTEEIDERKDRGDDLFGAGYVAVMHQLGNTGIDQLGPFLDVEAGLIDIYHMALAALIKNRHFFIQIRGVVDMDINEAGFFFQLEKGGFTGVKGGAAFLSFEDLFLVVRIERKRNIGQPAFGPQFMLLQEFEDVLFIF